jgi:hypothetical protein
MKEKFDAHMQGIEQLKELTDNPSIESMQSKGKSLYELLFPNNLKPVYWNQRKK